MAYGIHAFKLLAVFGDVLTPCFEKYGPLSAVIKTKIKKKYFWNFYAGLLCTGAPLK
jgi:hypothetical protein